MYDYNNTQVRPQYALGKNIVPVGMPTGTVPQNATGGAVPQWALGQQNPTPIFGQSIQFAQNNT